jgi:hypothetical protein
VVQHKIAAVALELSFEKGAQGLRSLGSGHPQSMAELLDGLLKGGKAQARTEGKYCHMRVNAHPVEQIVDRYKTLLHKIWTVNPALKVVFTVSPIRHWKDGAIENQRSKAALLLAIDQLQNEFGDKCTYFPSYEIVMDELRDYRFYAADMLHLSDVAVDYIYQKFQEVLIDKGSKQIAEKVLKIRSAVLHKPFNPETTEFKKFLEQSYQKILDMEGQYPYLNLKLEKNYFIRHLENLGR